MAIFGITNKCLKNKGFRLNHQSGNVFFALFGALALVGVVGATATGIMSGPMKTMTKVSTRALSESEIMTNMRLATMAISQPGVTKDCDIDGTVEPLPFKTIAGQTPPVGGGFLPDGVAATSWKDAWGNYYGYCVWDHGNLVNNAGCGGAGQNRLAGLNTTSIPAGKVGGQTVIAVMSAGPDRTFQTRCETWTAADSNSDGDLDDAGDKQLANRPAGSDDLVMTYTYDEASIATSSNWKISGVTVNAATACARNDYTLINGKCYKFYSTLSYAWANGRTTCQVDGADLVTINDTAEFNAMNTLRGTNNVWVGYTDAAVEGTWKWLDSSSSYSNWSPSQPSGGTGFNCAYMWDNYAGQMDDNDCSIGRRFICEMSGVTGAVTDVRSGLVAEYLFDEASGTTVKDATGAHNGTFVNTPLRVNARATSRGKALDLQMADRDSVTIPGTMGLSQNLTLSAWANVSSYDTGNVGEIVGVGDRVHIFAATANVGMTRRDTSTFAGANGGGNIEGQGWKHVLGTYNGSSAKLYINGVKVAETALTNPIDWSGPASTNIGAMLGNPNFDFNGQIDDVRIYNRALSDTEVGQLYNYYQTGGVSLDAVNTEENIEVAGNTTVGGQVTTAGLKLADQNNSGACDEPNALALRTNNTTDPAVLEICDWDGSVGTWVSISGGADLDPLEDGLVGHWKLDETTGTSIADSMGTNTGTWSGSGAVSSIAGKQNSALIFDGTDDRVTTTSSAALVPSAMTVSAWVHHRASTAQTILRAEDGSGYVWNVFTNGGALLQFQVEGFSGGPNWGQWDASGALTQNAWNHIIISYDRASPGTPPSIYVNGQLRSLSQVSAPAGANTATSKPLIIGNRHNGAAPFNGYIDDVRLYNRILSPTEAAQLFIQSQSTYTCPTGYSTYGGTCYKIVTSATNSWSAARSACQADGAELVDIIDASEMSLINSIRTWQTWIGLTDAAVEGTWISSMRGVAATFFDWGPGEGATNASENCVFINNAGEMADQACTGGASKQYICEKVGTAAATAGGTSANLVAHWKMDETTGNTNFDSAGTNHMVWPYTSVRSVKGRIDGAINMANSGDVGYVAGGGTTPTLANKKRSISAWIYTRSYTGVGGGDTGVILTKYPNGWTFGVSPYRNTIVFSQNTTGSVGGWDATTNAIKLNAWHHVAVTYDSTSLSNRPVFYIDGVAQAITQWSAPTGSLNESGNIILGSESIYNYNGFVDDLRLYDGILSGEDIKTLYNSGLKPVGQSSRERYTTNQTSLNTRDVKDEPGTASAYGTSILLQSQDRGAEAGIGLRIDSTITDTSDATAAVTGVLAGNMGQGALNFKTSDGTNPLASRVTMDHTGSLGINTTASRALSSKIQIGDLSTPVTAFDVFAPNCIANRNSYATGPAMSNVRQVAGDGKYIYGRLATTIVAYRVNNGVSTAVGSALTYTATNIAADANYIYVGNGSEIRAYTFNGSAFTLAGTQTITHTGFTVKSGVVYVTSNQSVWSYSFNGSAFSARLPSTILTTGTGTSNGPIWTDGKNIVKSDTVTGGNWRLGYTRTDNTGTKPMYAGWIGGTGTINGIASDGKYVYAAGTDGTNALLSAYMIDENFNGSSGNGLNIVASLTSPPAGTFAGIWTDGNLIYVTDGAAGVKIYSFDGTNFTQVSSFDRATATGIWGDGKLLFVTSGTTTYAYSAMECTALSSFHPGYQRGMVVTATSPTVTLDAANATCSAAGVGPATVAINGGVATNIVSSWQRNGVLFYTEGTSLKATDLAGGTYTPAGSVALLGGGADIWGNSTHLFVAGAGTATNRGVAAFTYSNGSFTAAGAIDPGSAETATGVWSNGTYIFVASTAGVRAYSYNGTAFTLLATYAASSGLVTGDASYIYISDGTNIRALSFNGTAFTLRGTYNLDMFASAEILYAKGGYIFTNAAEVNLFALTFNGTSFSVAAQVVEGRWIEDIWGDGQNLYFAFSAPGNYAAMEAKSFNGSAFTTLSTYSINNPGNIYYTVIGDGTYIHALGLGSNSAMTSFNGFACSGYSIGSSGTVYIGAKGNGGTAPVASLLYSSSLALTEIASDGTSPVTKATFDTSGNLALNVPTFTVRSTSATYYGFSTFNDTPANAGVINLRRSRGTELSSATVANNDYIGSLQFSGYNGHANSLPSGGGHNAIVSRVNGTVNSSTVPMDLYFNYSNTGQALSAGAGGMVLTATKRLGIGTAIPSTATSPIAPLHVVGRAYAGNGVRIGMDSTCAAAADAGVLRMNSGALEYCNGSAWASVFTGGAIVTTTTNQCPYSTGYIRERGRVTSTDLAEVLSMGMINSSLAVAAGRSNDSLSVVNVSNPDAPVVASTLMIPSVDQPYRVDIKDNYVFVAANNNYVASYYVNPITGTATELRTLDATTSNVRNARAAKIVGSNYFYVANNSTVDSLAIFDISDPYNISHVGTFTHASINDPYDMKIQGNYLYVVSATSDSLTIIDISNPASPVFTGSITNASLDDAKGLVVNGNYAYILGEASTTLSVVDVSNPASPTLAGALTDSVFTNALKLIQVGNHLYAMTDEATQSYIVSIDITGPTNPIIKHKYRNLTGMPFNLDLLFTGKYLLLAARDNSSITVLDIGCDGQPPIDWRTAEKTEVRFAPAVAGQAARMGTSVALSGANLLVGTLTSTLSDALIRIYDTASGSLLRTIAPNLDHFSRSISTSGNIVVSGHHLDDTMGTDSGAAYVYNIQTGAQIGNKMYATDGATLETFARKVVIDGTYVAAGAHNHSTGKGAVYIYDALTTAFLYKLMAPTPVDGDYFGEGIATDGKYLAVGAPNASTNDGKVFVYDIATRQLLYTLSGNSDTEFGGNISISQGLMAINQLHVAPSDTFNMVKIYDVATGALLYSLQPDDVTADDKFGKGAFESLKIQGKYAIIGHPRSDTYATDAGAASIFDISSGYQIARLRPSNVGSGYRYGEATAIQNNMIAVGSGFENASDGAAYLYTGAPTTRQKSGVSCYPRPFDILDVKNKATSTAVATQEVMLEGVTGDCTLGISTEATGSVGYTISRADGTTVSGTFTGSYSIKARNKDRLKFTSITTPSTYNQKFRTYVTLGDQTDAFDVNTNTGFLVYSATSYNGNLGGLAGADSLCLTQVNSNDWMGKSSAGTLSANRVRAFLCDSTKCRNLLPLTTYSYAAAGQVGTGGGTFVSSNVSRGPGESATNWNASTRFGSTGGTLYHWSGRLDGASDTLWPTTVSGSNCTDWTSSSSGVNGDRGERASSNKTRWRQGSQGCNSSHRLLCIVDPLE